MNARLLAKHKANVRELPAYIARYERAGRNTEAERARLIYRESLAAIQRFTAAKKGSPDLSVEMDNQRS